ncbi:MAG: acyl-CoA-binding protein [Bdellovibrionaceae bacterium]|nr:acyl-CoA-binding protein [Bdellovibrionales bacterium]MCB9083192.1 acyl-CoA-binding protein [Pseudobdellovibrionaceae bacterium]
MNFEEAAQRVTTLSARPDNSTLLKLYSLFKQGSQGDVQGSRPGMLNVAGRAKYDAWKGLQGMSQDDAKDKYVQLVQQLVDKDGN